MLKEKIDCIFFDQMIFIAKHLKLLYKIILNFAI